MLEDEKEIDRIRANISTLEARIGYKFGNPDLVTLALTHKSFANERIGGVVATRLDNERFEFLGDAVLDLTMSDMLMRAFPEDSEGSLSKKRASLVNEETLAQIAGDLKLSELIRLGKGEVKTGGLSKPRITASCLEAIVGAVFLDGGYSPARAITERLFAARVGSLAQADFDFHLDFKTRLQEKIQEKYRATPTYRMESESGPDHDKHFHVSVAVAESVLAYGSGRSKKAAEQDAARKALEKLT